MNMISKLKINKTTRHVGIMLFFLKISANIIAHPLISAILYQCIELGYFPNKLKIAKVIPVFKAGPTNKYRSYRPISFLPSMPKIFERRILNSLVSFSQRNKIIIPTQFGFRRNHFNLYPILDIIRECYDNIYHKCFTTLLFLGNKKRL